MYEVVKIRDIKAQGWIKEFLKMQAENLTGEIDLVGFPFSVNCWGNKSFNAQDLPESFFLGGVYTEDDAWVPFEQTGYWIDGAERVACLIDDEKLRKKAESKISYVIDNPDKDGYLGASILKDKITWAHSIFFRAICAYYEETEDKKVLSALKAHYLRVPLKDVFEKQKNSPRILYVRNIADIEVALWLYDKTSDKRLLNAAEESYKVFNEIFKSDKGVSPDSEMKDLTLKGMLANRKVCRNHGVTYCEICKLPAILYKYTGKEEYKKAAVNAFEKLYRDQMIIDGVNSSTEYLNGNDDSLASHETCDISDLTWALFYLYEITGDKKYGDRIENAVINAGLGAVDESFRGNQYFSCPNQVISNDTSNHLDFYKGEDWMSFSPKTFLACCAGNVHRFMPNYICKSWFIDYNKKEIYPSVYAPTEICAKIDGVHINVKEITEYPYKESVVFKVNAEKPVKFTLKLRVPEWATESECSVNGEKFSEKEGYYYIEKVFLDDEIQINFQSEIKFIENAGGISVKKGAVLYALPVKPKKVIEGLRALGNEKYPHYSLYPNSKWSYALTKESIETAKHDSDKNQITITAKILNGWKLQKSLNGKRKLNPRGKSVPIGHTCYFTPKVPKKVKAERLGNAEEIMLVPYGNAKLRIAIFPFYKGE